MKETIKKKYFTGSVLILAAIFVFLINIASNIFFKSYRLDLTSGRIYTLSQGTKDIIKSLEEEEPVILRFYFSKNLAKKSPFLMSFGNRIQELLQQYQRLSNKKILLEIIDPEPFTVDEDAAVNYGLQAVPVDNDGGELYFGLVGTNSTTAKETIPFFQPNREAYVEYDITRLIHSLTNNKSKTIGFMSSVPMHGSTGYGSPGQTEPWVIWQQINQQYKVNLLSQDLEKIPDEINVLMLVNPSAITEKAIYAIDQFVMRGGHVMAFVDPHTEVDASQSYQNSDENGDDFKLKKLFTSWGVEFDNSKIVAARDVAKQVRYRHNDKDFVGLYPFWMDFGQDNLAKEDILTGSLQEITFASPGAIKPIDNASTKFVDLIKTSKDAMLVDKNKAVEYKENPRLLLQNYEPGGENLTIAARITGSIKSAFPDGFADNKKSHIASIDTANVIVVADVDMLYDHFWVNVQNFLGNRLVMPTSGNGNFVLSALDNLSGSSALISIRNKTNFVRHFDKVREIELRSQERFHDTELSLTDKLDQTKQKLVQLENQKKEGNSLSLSVRQRQEEEVFRKELIETRTQLRDVRYELRKDIEKLETNIKFFSILFFPLIIVLGGLFYWGFKLRDQNQRLAKYEP